MRLEMMKLSGFKSFVDPTVIHFPGNLAGVVGPNGCGKSNVIDAIRWVMGESSATKLRAEAGTDVIFNGSQGRQPVGQASVELVFDNSDHRITGEFAAYQQIAIRREINRDSQSNYYLNGTRCRRKDITRVFLGTGLGPRSYSIIEQGMISRFVEAKPEDLRTYLEEVAGISKYKDRRRETELRMQHTRDNLVRLSDVRDELEKQLQQLQRQAAAAERYKAYKAEERQGRAELWVLQYQAIQATLAEFDRQLLEHETARESKQADYQRVEREIEETRQSHITSSDALNDLQQQFYTVGNEVTRIEQTIAHQKERKEQLERDHAQLERDYAALSTHKQQDHATMASLSSQLDEWEPQLHDTERESDEAGERLLDAEERLSAWRKHWEAFTHELQSALRIGDVEKTKIAHIERSIAQTKTRIDALSIEKNTLHADDFAKEVSERTEMLRTLEGELHGLEDEMTALTDEWQASKQREKTARESLDARRNELSKHTARIASLEAMQQAAQDAAREPLKQWLRTHALDSREALFSALTVTAGWETAVETVLGGALEAICVDDVTTYATALSDLTSGNITLCVRSNTAVVSDARLLASKVKSTVDLSPWLANVYVADDVDSAYALLATLPAHASVMTSAGVWLGKTWVRVARAVDANASKLARQKNLAALREMSVTVQAALDEAVMQFENSRRAIEETDLRRQQKQRLFHECNARHADEQAALRVAQERLSRTKKRISDVQAELSALENTHNTAQKEWTEAQRTLQQSQGRATAQENHRESLLNEQEQLTSDLADAKMQAREARDAWQNLESQYQATKRQFDTLTVTAERVETQLQQVTLRREQLSLALTEQASPDVNWQQALQDAVTARLSIERELREVRSQVELLDSRLHTLEETRALLTTKISSMRDQSEQLKLDSQSLRVRADTFLEQLTQHHHVFDDVSAVIPAHATIDEWQSNLAQVEARIARLGPVNLAATDELAIQSERKTYLDAQHEDLEKALFVLAEAIAKIDKETEDTFKYTFDTINANLSELFPKVFGGGSAYLQMTSNDLLDAGVTLMAHPPGKKNASIHLLSGGEKALTAISLVFAIFRLNPSPFCLLDEVDAPLDDSNVVRYCRLVKEMSAQVQFIFITHNKVAMEMAEQLMGVTMQEPGVSRLVTVDVKEAVEMATA